MRPRPAHALLLAPLMLAACGSGVQNSTSVLNQRLQTRLATPIQQGDVAVTRKVDGAAVTFLRPSGTTVLTEPEQYALASTVEGLIDPTLVEIKLANTLAPDGYIEQQQLLATQAYFKNYAINAYATPLAPIAGAPTGLTVDITVHCPPSHSSWNFTYDQRYPTCW